MGMATINLFSYFNYFQKSQINQANVVWVVAHRFSLTTSWWNIFKHIAVIQKKWEFHNPYFQAMLFLLTMTYLKNFFLRQKFTSSASFFTRSLTNASTLLNFPITSAYLTYFSVKWVKLAKTWASLKYFV